MSTLSRFEGREIFISYNRPAKRDTNLFQGLMNHLAPLKNEYPDLKWGNSNKIEAGKDINRSLEDYLNTADIIVLLLSSDYLASPDCYEREMQPTLTRHHAGNVHMILVLLRPIDKKSALLAPYHLLPSNGVPLSRWSDRDEAFVEITTEIRLAVDELMKTATRHSHADPRRTFASTPFYGANDFFTDREAVLAKIASSFAAAQKQNTPILALNGLPGIGKTQIAQAYVYYPHASRIYQKMLWLNASSRALLSKDVSIYATLFSLSEEKDEKLLFITFKQWLQEEQGWLLVLDSLEDIDLIDLVIPSYSKGHVLLTTRKQATGRYAFPITVTSMDTDAGALFLLRRAKILWHQDSLEQAPPATVSKARAIAQALNEFPLALEQAGAYIEETGCSLTTYLSLYQEQRTRIFSEQGQLADDDHQSVIGTFDLVFQQVAQTSAASLDLLHLLAFLHPDAIFDELFTNGAPVLPGTLRTLVADSQKLLQTFAVLLNFSLISWSAERTLLQMHRIVQDVLIDTLTMRQQRRWAQLAVRLVNHVFPEVSFDTWSDCQRYLPHAQQCAILITKYQLSLKEGALLLERLGSFCSQSASYEDAERYLLQALHLYERYWSTNTLDRTQALNSLGLLYHQQARYKEAEACHQLALEMRERVQGPDDPKTTESLHNLAMIYGDMGKYQKAEYLYLRVLSLEERTEGSDRTDVADTLNELGLTYTQQGRFAEAKTAYQRAFTIFEHSRNINHPDLTYPLDGLGVLAEQQGDYQQAERLYQQAFAICKRAFGEKHPETAHSINKLAGIAVLQNDYDRAEILYQQALGIYEQKLGPRHPDVALVLNDWGLLATKQRHYQKAREFYERALSIYELVLGPEHPDVASVLNNLGLLSYEMGNKERAKKLLQRSLAIREKTFDPTHPSIAESLRNLAKVQNDE
jgi:tetratricopeptide (TPR) repeat protein